MIDHYRTIGGPAEYRHKIERSDFLGIALPVGTDEEFFEKLAELTKRHYDATHLCWAFRLFGNGEIRARSADAGEPSGTAGKPILAAIEGADFCDIAVVVVRWYGGVKLGTGGLSRAYRQTASQALEQVSVVDRYVYRRFRILVPFDQLSVVYRLLDAPNIVLAAEHFGEQNVFDIDVRLARAEEFLRLLAERRVEVLA